MGAQDPRIQNCSARSGRYIAQGYKTAVQKSMIPRIQDNQRHDCIGMYSTKDWQWLTNNIGLYNSLSGKGKWRHSIVDALLPHKLLFNGSMLLKTSEIDRTLYDYHFCFPTKPKSRSCQIPRLLPRPYLLAKSEMRTSMKSFQHKLEAESLRV